MGRADLDVPIDPQQLTGERITFGFGTSGTRVIHEDTSRRTQQAILYFRDVAKDRGAIIMSG